MISKGLSQLGPKFIGMIQEPLPTYSESFLVEVDCFSIELC